MSRSSSFGVIAFILSALGCEAAPPPAPSEPPPAPVADQTPTKVAPEQVAEVIVDAPSYRVAAQRVPDKLAYERVFSVPDGPKGLWIQRKPVNEDGASGPLGCAVDDDGSFWFLDIGDAQATFTRFVHYSAEGKRLGATNTDGHQLEGLVASGGHLYARDRLQTSLLRFSLEGKIEQKVPYSGVDRLARLADKLAAIRSSSLAPVPDPGQDLTPGPQASELSHRGVRYVLGKDSIQIGHQRTRIEEMETIKLKGLLGLSEQGDLLVSIHDEQGPQTVLRFDATGKLTGHAWVPSESVLFVPHPLCVDAQGNVFATITREKRVDIVKLTFVPAVL